MTAAELAANLSVSLSAGRAQAQILADAVRRALADYKTGRATK